MAAFTFGSLYAGGGLATIGIIQAGGIPLFAIDNDPAACATYAANIGEHILCQSVQDVDPHTLPPVDLLQASPSCKSYSQARSRTLVIDEEDASMGRAIIPYLEVLRPRVFLLENVSMYRHSAVFAEIVDALWRLGYMVSWDLLNSYHYNVPQTRIRLIVRAVLGGLVPPLPPPVLGSGWLAAIEDLIPTLPESAFAAWQKIRLAGRDWAVPFLHMTGTAQMASPTGTGIVPVDEPSNTVTAASGAARAYLVHPTASHSDGLPVRGEAEPACTMRTGGGMPRAYLVSGTDATTRQEDEPAHTLTATLDRHTASPRAILMRPDHTRQDWGKGFRTEDEPAATGDGSSDGTRAFIVDCTTGERTDEAGNRMLTIREAADPMFTVAANAGTNRAIPRAGVPPGRVVSLTPRALARLMSVGDSYILPSTRADALRIIGNGCCPEMIRRLVLPLMAADTAQIEEREKA